MKTLLDLTDSRRKEYDNKIVILSGGLDSTYVLLKEVRKAYENNIKDISNMISCVYINHANILTEKKEKEIESINKILQKIKEDYDYQIYLDVLTVKLENSEEKDKISLSRYSSNSTDIIYGSQIYSQTLLWTGCIMQIIPNLHMSTEILLGYLLSDQMIAYKALMIKNTIEELGNNLFDSENSNKPFIQVSFPLIFSSKNQIIYEMERDFPEYLKLVWFCEDPKKGKPCGKCEPCISYKLAKQKNKMIGLKVVKEKEICIKEN